jgi:hypothetical protein
MELLFTTIAALLFPREALTGFILLLKLVRSKQGWCWYSGIKDPREHQGCRRSVNKNGCRATFSLSLLPILDAGYVEVMYIPFRILM